MLLSHRYGSGHLLFEPVTYPTQAPLMEFSRYQQNSLCSAAFWTHPLLQSWVSPLLKTGQFFTTDRAPSTACTSPILKNGPKPKSPRCLSVKCSIFLFSVRVKLLDVTVSGFPSLLPYLLVSLWQVSLLK